MALIREVLQWIGSLAVQQTILALILATSVLVAIEERRISVIAFLAQYGLLFLLLSGRIYRHVAAIKGLIGFPIAAILFISATHVQRGLRELRKRVAGDGDKPATRWQRMLGARLGRARPEENTEAEGPTAGPRRQPLPILGSTSSSFRVLVMALGAAGAYGLWQAHPIGLLSAQVNLAFYWLAASGLLLAATSQDPLRIGMGLLTLLNGFEAAFYTLNASLALVALLGSAEILLALATSNAAERWRAGIAQAEAQQI